MSNTTLHWSFRRIMREFRADGRLAVYLCYVLHGNKRNRAWPSAEILVHETGWHRAAVVSAKKWLMEHGALERVPHNKRMGEEIALHQRLDVMQITGVVILDGETYPLLHGNILLGEIIDPANISASKILLSETEGSTTSEGIPSISDEIEGEQAPAPADRPEKKGAVLLPDGTKAANHPGVIAFRELTQAYPARAWMLSVCEAVDLHGVETWRKVIVAWTGRGFSPRNVAGMLDWLEQGIPPKGFKPHVSKPSPDVHTGGQAPANVLEGLAKKSKDGGQ